MQNFYIENINQITFHDKSHNFVIQTFIKNNDEERYDNIYDEIIMSKKYLNIIFHIDVIESLLLNLINNNNYYGLQITKKIGKDIMKKRKQYSMQTKKYKLFI